MIKSQLRRRNCHYHPCKNVVVSGAANGKTLTISLRNPTEARQAEEVSQSAVLSHSPVSRDQTHSTPSIAAGQDQGRRVLRPQLSFRPGVLSRLDRR